MDIVERIRGRPNDAPMPTERLLDDAAAEIERLRAALKRYGLHEWDCPRNDVPESTECTCGLDAVEQQHLLRPQVLSGPAVERDRAVKDGGDVEQTYDEAMAREHGPALNRER